MKVLHLAAWWFVLPLALFGQDEEPNPFLSGWDITGEVEAEFRTFFESPLDPRAFEHFDGSIAAQVEFFRDWTGAQSSFAFTPFGRFDVEDGERSHWDIREALFQKYSDRWDFKFGVGKVFWGVTESQHLVDTINQTDFVENIDGEEKLGQPMLNFSWITEQAGTFGIYYLPYFRERTFPGVDGRLRFNPPVDADSPVFESSLENWHPDVALRWSAFFGEFDIGLHYFHGTSRDPLYQFSSNATGEPVLLPVYNLMHQTGLDLQWTHNGWLWKVEALARSGLGQHYQAVVGGVEYTLYGILGSDGDLGLISEASYDTRGNLAITPFNHDLFKGVRWTPNDTQDTALLAGVLWDWENNTTYLRVEFERRIGENYTINAESQWFAKSTPQDLLYTLRNDSFFILSLSRYF